MGLMEQINIHMKPSEVRLQDIKLPDLLLPALAHQVYHDYVESYGENRTFWEYAGVDCEPVALVFFQGAVVRGGGRGILFKTEEDLVHFKLKWPMM